MTLESSGEHVCEAFTTGGFDHQNSAGHGGRRCETARKTKIKIHGHHQEGHQKECADGRQHSRPQELEIGSVQGDPLTWKSLQGEMVRI